MGARASERAASAARAGTIYEKFQEASASSDAQRAERLIAEAMQELGDWSALREKDYTAAQRRELASKGHALPDGSYPIEDKEDLHNAAVLAASGHGDVSAAKALIKRRAKQLGVKPSSLPGMGKGNAREADPVSVREAVARGDLGLTEALSSHDDANKLGLLRAVLGDDADLAA